MVPVREVQKKLGTEAEVLGCLMGTEEGEQRLTCGLRKDHGRCFGTRHITLRSTEDMQAEDGVSFYESLAVA
jgi:hypothetical protein